MSRLAHFAVRGVLVFVGLILAAVIIYRAAFMPHFPDLANVAHAGGGVGDAAMTNSIAALDFSYGRGFRLFETDITKTSDGHVVCGHDWDGSGGPMTLEAFLTWRQTRAYPPCTEGELTGWFIGHPDARLITDSKVDAIGLNKRLHAALGGSLIAQVYNAEQVCALHESGIRKVILTFYRIPFQAIEVIRELSSPCLKRLRPMAVTLSRRRVIWGEALLVKLISGLPVYTHTVNTCAASHAFWLLGVDANYSDRLRKGDCKWIIAAVEGNRT